MKAFVAYDGGAGPEEGAILIFAASHKRARALAFPTLSDLMCCEFVDMRCHSLSAGADEMARQNEVSTNSESVIDSPKCCARCSTWGNAMNERGICTNCQEDESPHDRDPVMQWASRRRLCGHTPISWC